MNNIKQVAKGEKIIQAAGDIFIGQPFYATIPKVDCEYIERKEEKDIIEMLNDTPVLCIYGISGIGKTAIAITIANKLCCDFDKGYFVDGNRLDLKTNEIIYSKANYSESLEGLLVNKKSFILIDDLNKKTAQLIEKMSDILISNDSKSKVIITSQNSKYISNNRKYEVQHPDEDICRKVLLNKIDIAISDEEIQYIFQGTSYNPLMLKVLNNMLRNKDLTVKDCTDNVVTLEDPDGNLSLANRLIGVLYSAYPEELKLIKWFNTTYYDKNILLKLIKTGAYQSLIDRAIIDLSETVNQYTIKIHDIILKSIEYLVPINEGDEEKFLKNFTGYFKEMDETMTYFNALFMHKKIIKKYWDKKVEWGELLYLYLKSSNYDDIDFEKLEELEVVTDIVLSYEEYVSIIEFWERKATKLKNKIGNYEVAYETFLRYCKNIMEKFLTAMIENAENEKKKWFLTHHLGKFCLRLNEDAEAKKCFQQVLGNDENFYASKLQLIRIFIRESDLDEAKRYLFDILNDYYFNGKDIDTTIVLAALKELRKSEFKELYKTFIIENYDIFKSIILDSSNFYFDLPFKVFVELGKALVYNHREKYDEIAHQLPIKISDEITDNQLLFSIGEYYKDWYKSTGQSNKALLTEAKKYYMRMTIYSDYQLRLFAQVYTLLKDNATALEVLNRIKVKEELFVQYDYAKIHYDMKQYPQALDSIEISINLSTEHDKYNKYKSMLFALQGKIKYFLNSDDWEVSYNKAVESCENDKYQSELLEQKSQLLNM